MGLVARLRGVLGGNTNDVPQDSRQKGKNDSVPRENRPSLFQCPSCETVYIAIEMAQCSRCDVGVEDIPSARPQLARSVDREPEGNNRAQVEANIR